jgi:hypothetical protein
VVEGILKEIRRTPLWRRNELLALIAISPFAPHEAGLRANG